MFANFSALLLIELGFWKAFGKYCIASFIDIIRTSFQSAGFQEPDRSWWYFKKYSEINWDSFWKCWNKASDIIFIWLVSKLPPGLGGKKLVSRNSLEAGDFLRFLVEFLHFFKKLWCLGAVTEILQIFSKKV